MGLNDIIKKESWMDATKIMDSRLRCSPFWHHPTSKALITTNTNSAASAWWEELLYHYMSILFVGESGFDGNEFKMIEHIDKYFNPSTAVNLLGYIFELINIKHGTKENIVLLKAWFSWVFALLNMGCVMIDSALQVGFMLWALLSCYQVVIQDF
jgi:hypothetical protein